jgi:F420-non-reducing hydrogenase small subunit
MAKKQSTTKAPVTINTEWLSDCSGCHVAIVDVHEKILNILEAVQILHCPVLTDIKDYPKANIGLVSGAIRTEHDRHAAEAMRASCDTIIAWGSCAVYGGIAGAGTVHTKEEIFDTVYINNKTTTSHVAPTSEISPFEKFVTPIDEVIDVDLYLPGCPPHPAFIFDALIALVEGRTPKATKESVCARCTRTMKKTETTAIKKNSDGVPDAQTCFLSQGYLCMGSVTLDRCMSPCPTNGMMCTGCAGATMQVLTEPNRDIRTEIADRMTRLTKIDRESIVKEIEHSAKTHYSYTMASKMIGQKPTFLIHQWIKDTEAEYE